MSNYSYYVVRSITCRCICERLHTWSRTGRELIAFTDVRRCSRAVRDYKEKLHEDADCKDEAGSWEHGQKSGYVAAADCSMTLNTELATERHDGQVQCF